VAFGWLWLVDGVRPTKWDIAGVVVALAGMAIILFAPRQGERSCIEYRDLVRSVERRASRCMA
jgi:hypothetical protein